MPGSPRTSSAAPVWTALALVLLLVGAARAAEPAAFDPSRVPLDMIREWTEGKRSYEDLQAVAAGKAAPMPLPQPKVAEPDKKDAKEDPKAPAPGEGEKGEKPEKAAEGEPQRPAWEPARKGDRRPDPEDFTVFIKQLYPAALQDQVARARPRSREYIDVLRRFDQCPKGSQELFSLMSNQKNFERMNRDGEMERWFWEMVVLSTENPQWNKVDYFAELWHKHRVEYIENSAKNEDYVKHHLDRDDKEHKKYYDYFQKESRTQYKTLADLDARGDTEPEALWELCERYADRRPFSPLGYLRTLMKLRTWFPDFKQVKSGEVQNRIARVLYDGGLEMYKESADAAEFLVENFPNYDQVKRGDSQLLEADARYKQGDFEANPGKKVDIWRVAQDKYRTFQKAFPKHWANLTDEKRPVSYVNDKLNRMKGFLFNKP